MAGKRSYFCISTPLICLLLFAPLLACSSRKELTPATAAKLVQEAFEKRQDNTFANGGMVIGDYSQLDKYVRQETFLDLTQGPHTTGTPIEVVARSLLSAGFIQQERVSKDFPNLSGTYRTSGTFPVEYTLSMNQNSLSITGTYRAAAQVNPNNHEVVAWLTGSISGHVNADGSIFLIPKTAATFYTPFDSDKRGTYGVKQDGNNVVLNGPLNMSGALSQPPISMTQFQYKFSPTFTAQELPGLKMAIGKVNVLDVTNLLLGSDVDAHGDYRIHIVFNDLGKAISGKPDLTTTGIANFQKQPDGNWICVSTAP